MSQPTWQEISTTIRSVIATASGLTTIWRFQNANQPALDYLDIALGSAATQWVDWVDESYDESRPSGQQIVLTVGGLREVPLKLQAWSAAVVDEVAKATALSILDAVVTRLRLPRARDALAAVGVTPFDPGPVLWVPPVVSAGFRGRATCDVRCRMPARALEEYADWIAHIEGSVQVLDGDGEVIVPFEAP